MSRSLFEVTKHYRDDLGFSVIPLAYKSKYPVTAWKRYQSRKPDDKELTKWFHRQDRNVGIVTGEVSGGLCVIDFDSLTLYKVWSQKINTPFPIVQTGKGVHVYVLCDAKTGKAYFQGKHFGEIRSDGGYVVAPPSVHPNGKQYSWNWREGLLQLESLHDIHIEVRKMEKPAKRGKAGNQGNGQSVRSKNIPGYVRNQKAYCQVAFSNEIRNILNAPKPTDTSAGRRNTTLFNAVWKLKRYFGILDRGEVLAKLSDAASKRGLSDREIQRTIESALSY